jgi:SAM-dependent methyltransferase
MNTPSNRHFGLAPSPWVVRFAHLISRGARVLDLACGYGRHALFFAARGARVVAVDRDAAALATFAGTDGVQMRCVDLEGADWPFAHESFDAIVVNHYLHRPLFPYLRAALRADGTLLYETFAEGNEVYGRPANPAFLLQRNELLAEAARGSPPLQLVAFEQGLVEDGERGAVVQRLAAVGAGRAWPPPLAGGPGR